MRVCWLLTLAACGAPISNAPFLEEAEFVGLLPTSDRFGPPVQVLRAAGTDPVLQSAKVAAAAYQEIVALPTLVGDELQAIGPSVREEFRREWEPTRIRMLEPPQALGLSGELELWVQAAVERFASSDDELFLTLEVAPTRGGPWGLVAEGGWDGQGRGELSWNHDELATVLDIVPPAPLGTLDATFDDHGLDEVERVVELGQFFDSGEEEAFVVAGETLFSFAALLEVTSDGLAWPGYATVVHRQDQGGYASGAVYRDAEEITFVHCWDIAGLTRHTRGDPGIEATGDASQCISGAP